MRKWIAAVCAFALFYSSASAETISIDFNTYALKENMANMSGADTVFEAGNNWNHVSLPHKNDGVLVAKDLVDYQGSSTSVSLHVEGPKITSWWSKKKLMPESKLYRDYIAFPKTAEIHISGLKPKTEYHVAIFGYPLNWGNVTMILNNEKIKVQSAPEFKDKRNIAGVLKVSTDEQGDLRGTVKGMLSGLHISSDPLEIKNTELVMLEGEPEKEAPPKYAPSKTVVYKTIQGVDLHLDIYNPKNHQISDKRPAAVFFHGGSWSGGWKTIFSPQCQYLAQHGMVGITVEYRVTGRPPKSTPAECVKDAKSAMRWVRKNAPSLGIDPDRIIAGGGSAGGHLAGAVAYLDGYNEEGEDMSISCRPQALILFNPVIDNGPGGGYHFGPQPIAQTWKGWSPMHNITPEKVVPTIFLLGDKDHLISVKKGEEYKALTEKAGANCEYYVYPGIKHGLHSWGKVLGDALDKTGAFLKKHNFLTATN